MVYTPSPEDNLDEKEKQELQNILKLVNRPGTENEVKTLTVANIYLKKGQNTKAIEMLEKSGIQTASVFLALGDIYRFDGVNNRQAQDNYVKAIERASSVKDGQVVVLAKAGLAKIALATGDTKAVDRLYEEARATFQDLKDAEKWDEVEQKLSSSDSEEKTLVFLSSCPNCNFFGGDGRISGGNVCRGC